MGRINWSEIENAVQNNEEQKGITLYESIGFCIWAIITFARWKACGELGSAMLWAISLESTAIGCILFLHSIFDVTVIGVKIALHKWDAEPEEKQRILKVQGTFFLSGLFLGAMFPVSYLFGLF